MIVASFLLIINSIVTATTLSPFNGRHVIISGTGSSPVGNFGVIRNSTGHITRITGIAGKILEWLSTCYNFTYSPHQINSSSFDDTKNQIGVLHRMNLGECDVVASVAPTKSRLLLADFSHPFAYVPVSYLIPTPHSTLDFLAAIRPFPLSIWIWILIAIPIVYVSVSFLGKFYSANKEEVIRNNGPTLAFNTLGTFLKQAGYYATKSTPVRIVVGLWGLTVFILHNYYTSDLTSFMTAPNPQPLIKSIYELNDRPDILVVTDSGTNGATLILTAESGFLKTLGDKLRDFPKSGCSKSIACVEMVNSGRTVYISGRDTFLLEAMKKDFAATGSCNLQMGHEVFNFWLHWTTRKNSPYMDSLNKGLMRMREAGLIDKWNRENLPDVRQCIDSSQQQSTDGKEPLNLKSLSGAFALFIIGLTLSFIVLIGEFNYNYFYGLYVVVL